LMPAARFVGGIAMCASLITAPGRAGAASIIDDWANVTVPPPPSTAMGSGSPQRSG
jgi:hypothetical protein